MLSVQVDNLIACNRRVEGSRLLGECLEIAISKASMFTNEFDNELHPERTVGKCWRYSQDLLHDYYTAMGPALRADQWCLEGRQLLNDIGDSLGQFIHTVLESFDLLGGPLYSDEHCTSEVDASNVEACRQRLKDAADIARILEQTLTGIRQRAESLKNKYQVEHQQLVARLTTGNASN